MEKHNISYVSSFIDALVEDPDNHMLIAMRDKNGNITGNILDWPQTNPKVKDQWTDFTIPADIEDDITENDTPTTVMANIIHYPKGRSLMVAYDLKRLDVMKHALWTALFINAILSFIAALFLTFLIIFILNRYMRKLNITCTEVMQGNNLHRVKLSGANDEFERLGNNLNAMLNRNEALLNTVKESTNALAHDMRTPLSRLRISLQRIIEKPNVPAHVQEDLVSSVGQIDKLVEMFQNILSIAKAESRTQTDIFISFDIVALIRDIIDFYGTFIEDKKQVLKTNLPEEIVIFRGDRQLIAQSVLNLLDNAVKYTPVKGNISISLEKSADSITIIIADSGPGIEAEFREKVKERFFRLDASRSEEGTGLGMSLVDAVAKLHNGELLLEDNNPGLKISFVLPVK